MEQDFYKEQQEKIAQQATPPPQQENIPPAKKPSKILTLIGALLLLGIGAAGGYFLAQTTMKEETEALSPTPTIAAPTISPTQQVTSAVPADWTVMTSKTCNIQIPLPPKKPPYAMPDDPKTDYPIGDEGKYWRFEESKTQADINSDYTDIVHVFMRADDELGSGYVAGSVYVQCAKNIKKLSTAGLVEHFEKPFTGDPNSVLKVTKKETLTLSGQQLTAVYVNGGMFDGTLPTYLVATKDHLYQITNVSMSTNPFIKETTEKIFSLIQFNDK